MTLPRPIRGIIPPVLTPLSDRDTLVAAAFDRLLEHLITGGSSALFILGSTGEAPGLSYRLRREVVDRACAHAAQRVPILVGITDTSFVESLRAGVCGQSGRFRARSLSAVLLHVEPVRISRLPGADRGAPAVGSVPLQHAELYQDRDLAREGQGCGCNAQRLRPQGQLRRPRLFSRMQGSSVRATRFRPSRRCRRDPRGTGRRRGARRRVRGRARISSLACTCNCTRQRRAATAKRSNGFRES
jgi:hypothetical protein